MLKKLKSNSFLMSFFDSIKLTLVKKSLYEWTQTCTCHAIPNLFRPINPVARIMWLACLLGSTGLCTYLVVTNVLTFLAYETNTQVNVYPVNNNFEMPAIGICSQSMFATPNGTEYVRQYLQGVYGWPKYNLTNLTSLSDLLVGLNVSTDLLDRDIERLQLRVSQVDVNDSTRQSYGYSFDTSFISCNINSKKCTDDLFAWRFDPIYGNCYDFNSYLAASERMVDMPGKQNGLQLEFFLGPPHLDSAKRLYYYNRYDGLHLTIYNKTYRPLNNIEGIDIQTGTCTTIHMSKTMVSHLGAPYGDCIDMSSSGSYSSFIVDAMRAENITYRQENCLEYCRQSYIINDCGCYYMNYGNVFYNNSNPNSSIPCLSKDQLGCINDASKWFENDNFQFNVDCQDNYCPLECDSVTYDFFESIVDYPSQVYAEFLAMDTSNNKIASTFQEENVPLTYENIKKSMVCLNVYFDRLQYTMITETPSMLLIDLISNAGGTCGLFLGISLLSFVEIAEIFSELIIILFKRIEDPGRSHKVAPFSDSLTPVDEIERDIINQAILTKK